MTNIEKNTAIAELCGAKKEQWYPFNKDTGSTGIYLMMPHKRFFPNGERWCGDSQLKYDVSNDWQYKVISLLKKRGFGMQISWDYVLIVDLENNKNDGLVYLSVGDNLKLTIFEALYQFTLYAKEKSLSLTNN